MNIPKILQITALPLTFRVLKQPPDHIGKDFLDNLRAFLVILQIHMKQAGQHGLQPDIIFPAVFKRTGFVNLLR